MTADRFNLNEKCSNMSCDYRRLGSLAACSDGVVSLASYDTVARMSEATCGPTPETKGSDIASLIRATSRHKDGEDWDARRSQHQSERKDVAGNGRAGHPAPLRADQRVAPAGAAVRLRPRPVRLVLGPCRRGGGSLLHRSRRKHRPGT